MEVGVFSCFGMCECVGIGYSGYLCEKLKKINDYCCMCFVKYGFLILLKVYRLLLKLLYISMKCFKPMIRIRLLSFNFDTIESIIL